MRRSFLLLATCFALLLTSSAYAGVLLPDEIANQQDDSDSSSGYMGLSPRETPDEAPTTAAPSYQPPAATDQPYNSGAVDESDCGKDDSKCLTKRLTEGVSKGEDVMAILQQYTQDATAEGANTPTFQSLSDLPFSPGKNKVEIEVTPTQALNAKLLASGKFGTDEISTQKKDKGRPPLIVDDIPPLQYDKSFTDKSISVILGGNYKLSAKEAGEIERNLGYSMAEIPEKCQLRLDVTLNSSDRLNRYTGILLAGTKIDISYAGDLGAITVNPRMTCKPPATLPQNGGLILRTGSNVTIHLMGEKSCPVPQGLLRPQTLMLNYKGGTEISCIYK